MNDGDVASGHDRFSGWPPTTDLGRWSVALACVFVLGLAVMTIVVASGQRGDKTISDNWWISSPAIVAGISAVVSFVIGLVAILLFRERSHLVRATVLVEGFVVVFLIGELAVAH